MRVKINRNTTEVKCPHCKSDLDVSPEDIQYRYHFGHRSYLYVVCGACTKTIEVSEQALPSDWRPFIQNLIATETGEDY